MPTRTENEMITPLKRAVAVFGMNNNQQRHIITHKRAFTHKIPVNNY